MINLPRAERRNIARLVAKEKNVSLREAFRGPDSRRTALPKPGSKYMPHNGEQEKARRVRQMEAAL